MGLYMRKKIVPCLFAFVLLNFVPMQSRADDRYYLLLQARAANDSGEVARASAIYQDYLGEHPAVTGRKQGAFKKNPQYYLSNLLRAAGNLIGLQRTSGDFQGVGATLALLERVESDNFFGSKNRYTMAALFEENGDQDKALKWLRRIVEEQIQSPRQGNNKVFLRAVARLVTYYQEQGAEEEILSLKEKLKNSISVFDFDIIDREQVGSLLLNLGEEKLAEQVLTEIVFQARGQDFKTEEHAVVRSLTKLLKLKSDNLPESSRLMAALDEVRGDRELSPANQYALGLACLNGAEPQRGLSILEQLTEAQPESIQARKAMFVLGRASASSGDWEQAIRYYSEYVGRYPEPRFFSLKAYSRLIDCYWANFKNPDLVDAEVSNLADIVNDIAYFETQLNLARDLKNKGYDQLSEATFNLGLAEARRVLQGDIDDEKRLRTLWLIQKYAFPHDKNDLVEESATQALALVERDDQGSLRNSEKGRFIKSQALIWRSQARQNLGRMQEAEEDYSAFLAEFPESPDADFVLYSFGELCEKQGDSVRAQHLYQKVASGIWKDQARQKLKQQGLVQ